MTTPVSPAVRITTVVAAVIVALVAAVVSYSHMQEVAHRAGEEWRSWLIPLSIDGLVVTASMVLLTRHRTGLAGGWLAWGALGAGVVASLAANMADAQPTTTARLIAAWPAAAFAVAFELLLQQRRAEGSEPPTAQPVAEPVGGAESVVGIPLTAASAEPTPQALPVPHVASSAINPPRSVLDHVAGGAAATAPMAAPLVRTAAPSTTPTLKSAPSRVSRPPGPHPAGEDQLVERVRGLVDEAAAEGRPLGRRAVAKQLGVSEHQARVALDLVGATTGPALNGTGRRTDHKPAGRSAQ